MALSVGTSKTSRKRVLKNVAIFVGNARDWVPELIERAKSLRVTGGFEEGADLSASQPNYHGADTIVVDPSSPQQLRSVSKGSSILSTRKAAKSCLMAEVVRYRTTLKATSSDRRSSR